MVRASDSVATGQDFDPHWVAVFVSLSKTEFTPQKYW